MHINNSAGCAGPSGLQVQDTAHQGYHLPATGTTRTGGYTHYRAGLHQTQDYRGIFSTAPMGQ
eukprot:1143181-Pyramimonas_sp.AAC.1